MKKLKFLLFVLTILFVSCEKDKFEGPMLDNPNVEIEILQPLEVLGSTDFSNNQNTYFKASFTKQVDWKIKIKGLNSGSVKNISGSKSDFIDQSNSIWDGLNKNTFLYRLKRIVLLNYLLRTMTLL